MTALTRSYISPPSCCPWQRSGPRQPARRQQANPSPGRSPGHCRSGRSGRLPRPPEWRQRQHQWSSKKRSSAVRSSFAPFKSRFDLVETLADAVLIRHDLHQQAVVVDVRGDQHPKQGQRNCHDGDPVSSRQADLDIRVFDCHHVPYRNTRYGMVGVGSNVGSRSICASVSWTVTRRLAW